MSLQIFSILPAKFSEIHSMILILILFLHPDQLLVVLVGLLASERAHISATLTVLLEELPEGQSHLISQLT